MERGAQDPPHYLIQRVREAIAHDPRVAELELRVKMVGDKLFVTGSVSTEERRRAVSEIVRETLPDVELHNEISVAAFPLPADEETMS